MRKMTNLYLSDFTRKKVLFICGTLNQTTMMHQISCYLNEYHCFFTPYYADNFIDTLADKGYLDFSILGGHLKEKTINYLIDNNLELDYYGNSNDYDLVVTCSDLIFPKNIRNKRTILVQEGMTDPKNVMFYLVKWFKLPRYLASTSTNGMSDLYDYFCVASQGYKELFIKNGINPDKVRITGIPNYDNCMKYYNNDFPYKNFVLCATSDARETFKLENRKKTIINALEIANGRQLIFKLHPNENIARATSEIYKYAPDALVYTSGNIHEMIANCDVLITKFSTVVYTGISLGKEVYSDFDLDELMTLSPIQNEGKSAFNIAGLCRELIDSDLKRKKKKSYKFNYENYTAFKYKARNIFSIKNNKENYANINNSSSKNKFDKIAG